ncbi:MAG: hypothetical protein AAB368_12435, partial [bacterium]
MRLAVRPLLLIPLALAACAPAMRQTAQAPAAPAPAFTATITAEGGPVISLRGEPLTATRFVPEDFGQIPLGLWLNAVPMQEVQHGFQFAADLENCSGYGCIVTTADFNRVLVAKKGLADAVRLDLYDTGWKRFGMSAVNDRGWVAVPMASPKQEREVWVIKADGRLAGRIPHPVRTQAILRWRGEDLFLIHKPGDFEVLRLSLDMLSAVSATLVDPWWHECGKGEATARAIGLTGDIPE